MHRHIFKKAQMLCLLVVMVPGLVLAAEETRKPSGGRGKPPQEAIDACNGKSEGTTVEFTSPRGTVKGTCKSMNGQMVAVPEGGAPPPRQ